TSAGCGFQLDLFANAFCHDVLLVTVAGRLGQFTTGAHVGQDGINADLIDSAQRLGGYTQADPAVFTFDPEPARLQVGKETTLGLVVGVRDVVAHHRALAGNLAYACHGSPLVEICVKTAILL